MDSNSSATSATTTTTGSPDLSDVSAPPIVQRPSPLKVFVLAGSPLALYCRVYEQLHQNKLLPSIVTEQEALEKKLVSDVGRALCACQDVSSSAADKSTGDTNDKTLAGSVKSSLEDAYLHMYPVSVVLSSVHFITAVCDNMQKLGHVGVPGGGWFTLTHQLGTSASAQAVTVLNPTFAELAAALSGAATYRPYTSNSICLEQVPIMVPMSPGAWQIISCAMNGVFGPSVQHPPPNSCCFVLSDINNKRIGHIKSAYLLNLPQLQYSAYYFVRETHERLAWLTHCRKEMHPKEVLPVTNALPE